MTGVTGNTAGEYLKPTPRNVRPRTRKIKHLPVVAIANGMMLDELGNFRPADKLLSELESMPPTLFAKRAAADFIAELHFYFSEVRKDERWQWRATPHEREIVTPDNVRVASRVSTAIGFFGFKGRSYHKIIDPVTMYGHDLDKIWPDTGPTPIQQLLQWAVTLRDFCEKSGVDVRATIGGISRQWGTDRRFYPHARRKVPMAINERGREALPGNHYLLTVMASPRHEFTALYLDQHRAHHYHAQHTPLPCSNHLYAHGRFTDLAEITFKNVWDNFHGLYCLKLKPPSAKRQSHWIGQLDRAFVFSNELTHLYDLGYRVEGVYAAWGSFQRDTGVARYSQWAQQQLDDYGDKPWLKPLLLAMYGTLATRAKTVETIFCRARTGTPTTIFTGKNQLHGSLVKTSHKLEPGTVNVLQRGMIEAATRSESIGFAQYLSAQGHRVLAIYADAIIVEDDPDKILPSFPQPWRCKTNLNHLQFINQQAFISGEMTKLPGVCRELRPYRQATPGHAPRRVTYEALTGKQVKTERRI